MSYPIDLIDIAIGAFVISAVFGGVFAATGGIKNAHRVDVRRAARIGVHVAILGGLTLAVALLAWFAWTTTGAP